MSSRNASTSVSSRAYLKLLLHAAKYQSRACIGLLVGSTPAGSSAPSARTSNVHVSDVLPLFHTAPLAPMLELALTQADTLVRTAYGADAFIAGVYYAPELYAQGAEGSAASLPMPHASSVIKMADRLAANGGGAAGSRILMLDNVRLGALGAPNSESTNSALECFELRSGKWTPTGSVLLEDGQGAGDAEAALDRAVATMRTIMQNEQQRQLCDFDDHLDDAQADWTNKQFEQTVLPTAAR